MTSPSSEASPPYVWAAMTMHLGLSFISNQAEIIWSAAHQRCWTPRLQGCEECVSITHCFYPCHCLVDLGHYINADLMCKVLEA